MDGADVAFELCLEAFSPSKTHQAVQFSLFYPEEEFVFTFILISPKDPQASYDVNSNDPDPMPRYDATNENK